MLFPRQAVFATVLLLIGLSQAVTLAADSGDIYIEPALLDGMRSGQTRSMFVYLRERADLSAAREMNWEARGRFVYEQLVATAERSQARLLSHLSSRSVAYRSFWIDNVILIEEGDVSVLNDLTTFEEVRAIFGEQEIILFEPEDAGEASPLSDAIESNLTQVNAPDVWNLGYTGSGLVVASIDTGVRYTHSALVNRYRGNLGSGNFDHNYNWWDPYDNSAIPNDSHNHGSHVTGTMIGDDGGDNRIGIAPGAQWIACQGFNPASTTEALLECGQFMAAPWDLNQENPDPDRRPHVVNNSWGNCQREYNGFYEGVIDAWVAAGIVPIFSNGNAGNCNYTRPPGLNTVGNPGRYGKAFSIGSTGKDNGEYATHSNWGPSDNPSPGLPDYPDHMGFPNIKPNVVAPGVSIRSAGRNGDAHYYLSNGTSMSAPHVAGLIALMWEAAPCLVGDYATTGTLIMQTATPIDYDSGGHPPPGPDNVPNHATGWGEIDALAAVDAALDHCGTFSMSVTPEVARACAGDPAQFEFGVLGLEEFDDAVTLAVGDGLPGGASATFNPNPVIPADPAAVSVLTIADTSGLATASHRLWITGTSSGQSGDPVSRTLSVRLLIDADVLVVPVLGGPADGTDGTSLRPTFSWAGQTGEEYRIEVATDAGFTDIVIDETVAATFFRPDDELAPGVAHFWRVHGVNACGSGDWSGVFTFTTKNDPIADITPGSFGFQVPAGGSESGVLNIGNIGYSDLEWEIHTVDASPITDSGQIFADGPASGEELLFDPQIHEDEYGRRVDGVVMEPESASGIAGTSGSAGDWLPLGPWGADVYGLATSPIDPDLVLAGHALRGALSNGAIYRSTDGGQSWARVPNITSGVFDITFAPNGTVYAGSRGLWRSVDGGQNWVELNLGIGTNKQVYDVTIDPSNSSILWASVADANGNQPANLVRSTNGGQSWVNVTPPRDGTMSGRGVAIDPNDSNTVIAVFGGSIAGGQLWVTTDAGQSWINRTPVSFNNRPLKTVHYDGNRLLVGGGQVFNSQFVGLYESYDLGLTWQELHNADWPLLAVNDIAVDPDNADTILVATQGEGVNRTTDGGATWETMIGDTEGTIAERVSFAPGDSSRVFLGANALAVFRSDDGGDSFQSVSNGISELNVFHVAVNPNNPDEIGVAFQGQNNGGVYSSADGGVTWVLEAAPFTRYEAVGFSYEGTLYALSDGPTNTDQEGLYRREADGSWTLLGPDQGPLLESRLKTMRFSPSNPNLILLGGTDAFGAGNESTVWRSVNGGASWTKVYEGPETANRDVTAIELVEDGSDQVIIASYTTSTPGDTGGVLRSMDGGVTWVESSDGLTGTFLRNPRLCASPAGPQVFFMSIQTSNVTSSVFRTDNGGITWTNTGAEFSTRMWDIECDPVDPQVLFTSLTTREVLRSQDGGASFALFDNGLDGVNSPRTLAMAGYDRLLLGSARGVFATDTDSAVVACETPDEISWLDISPAAGVTAPGASSQVDVTVNTTGLSWGDYSARLCVTTNDPAAGLVVVPVSLTVVDPGLATLTGSVSGAGYCNADPGSLAGATVTVTGQSGTYQAVTNSVGQYSISLHEDESPVSVTVAMPDYLDDTQGGVTFAGGQTVTLDFDLTFGAPCATAAPDGFEFDLEPGGTVTQTLTLGNADGGIALEWEAGTSAPVFSTTRPVWSGDSRPAGGGNPYPVALSDLFDETPHDPRVFNTPAGGVIDCQNAPGLIIHDDGSVENGYGVNPAQVSQVAFVDLFTPSSYPVAIDAVCVSLLTQGGLQSTDFEIVVAADNGQGGRPGTILGSVSATFDNLPEWPVSTPTWVSVDISSLGITLESGSVYIGARWAPQTPNVFIAGDQSVDRPPDYAGGYIWNNSNNQWSPIVDSFPNYRALFVRAAVSDQTGCDDPQGADWLSVAPGSGSVPVSATSGLDVTVDTTTLAPGTHTGYVCISTNDPYQSIFRVPVEVTIDGAPQIEIQPDSLEVTLEQGQTGSDTLAIANTGAAALEWDIAVGEKTGAKGQGSEGLLLIPDSTNKRVMAFDPVNGDLVDANFIPADNNQSRIRDLILHPDGERFLVSDQFANVVWAYDLEGNPLGVFAPDTGPDPGVLGNNRGMAIHPDSGHLLVASASVGGNNHAVAEFDQNGTYLGNFVDTNAGGLTSPTALLFRENDLLVGSGDGKIFSFTHSGQFINIWNGDIVNASQMLELDNGNILASAFSGDDSGVWELDTNGNMIGVYGPPTRNQGVFELGNGNILTTNNITSLETIGVHEIDRNGNLVGTKIDDLWVWTITHFVPEIPPEPVECPLPAWLEVAPLSGTTEPGQSDTVMASFDAASLVPGEYTSEICVVSNDPDNPVVEVPVTLIVTEIPDPVPGMLEVTPEVVDFGKIRVGEQATQAVTVSNAAEAGAEALTLSVLEIAGAGEFTIGGGDCGPDTVLQAGENCTVEITFAPDMVGTSDGELNVEVQEPDDTVQSAQVELSGIGVEQPPEPGELAVTPLALDFDEVPVDGQSAQTVTISNAAAMGAEALTLSILETAGAGEFALSGGDCAIDTVLAAGDSCAVEITFAPATTGVFDGALNIEAQAPVAGPQSAQVMLSGIGTEEIPEPGVLDVSPAGLDFGDVEIDQSSSLSIAVSNTAEPGADALELSVLALDGDGVFAMTGGDCVQGLVLAAGQGCAIEVEFSPQAQSLYVGTVSVATSDGQSANVPLNGEGVELEDDIFSDRFEEKGER